MSSQNELERISIEHCHTHLTGYIAGNNKTQKTIHHCNGNNDNNPNESLVQHNKQNQDKEELYRSLGDKILKYEDVLLFSPNEPKSELITSSTS